MTQLFNTKPDIKNWLDRYGVKNYTLIPDETYGFVVDVAANVRLSQKNLQALGVQFRVVSGDFFCQNNQLTSLLGCPESVGGHFDCGHNFITSLLHAPKRVARSFNCQYNRITSLKNCPQHIGESFDCSNNSLNHMDALPDFVGYALYFFNNSNLRIRRVLDLSEAQTILQKYLIEAEQALLHANMAPTATQLSCHEIKPLTPRTKIYYKI